MPECLMPDEIRDSSAAQCRIVTVTAAPTRSAVNPRNIAEDAVWWYGGLAAFNLSL
jgi:hypothetical protein